MLWYEAVLCAHIKISTISSAAHVLPLLLCFFCALTVVSWIKGATQVVAAMPPALDPRDNLTENERKSISGHPTLQTCNTACLPLLKACLSSSSHHLPPLSSFLRVCVCMCVCVCVCGGGCVCVCVCVCGVRAAGL
jgi:hypothetical protein